MVKKIPIQRFPWITLHRMKKKNHQMKNILRHKLTRAKKEHKKSEKLSKTQSPKTTIPKRLKSRVAVQQIRAKKRKSIRFEEPKSKKDMKEDLEKKVEAKEEEAILLKKIIEDGTSQINPSTSQPTVSVNLTADYLSRYFVTPFATIEERAKESMIAAENKMKHLEKEKTDLEVRVNLELEGKLETVEKENFKTTALEEAKTKDMKIKNLQVEWIDRQAVEDKEVIVGNLRDEVQTILEAMKTVQMKDKKKTSFTQLATQVKGDFENLLKEHRDDFEHFRASLLSETEAPSTSGKSSS
ncbi:hypothetical protein R1sor_025995 [Riccia sorocarpa]|uniref:Uncharacterized protein n=1 Tax=Riccia sorocarpa TaxID=122646 RepID=A0ABD3GBT7_9MARC